MESPRSLTNNTAAHCRLFDCFFLYSDRIHTRLCQMLSTRIYIFCQKEIIAEGDLDQYKTYIKNSYKKMYFVDSLQKYL